jgi:hypothetical protein
MHAPACSSQKTDFLRHRLAGHHPAPLAQLHNNWLVV